MPMTNYLQDKMLNASLRGVSYTSPANVYVALYSTVNTPSTAGTELTGNNYARQLVTFSAAANGVINSNSAVTFSATGNAWLPAVSTGITDASTGGNILYYNNGVTRTVPANTTLTYGSGNITITIS